MQATLRSECPGRKSPLAAEPNKMTHSTFVAANSFSLFTNSVSFASVESISLFFLSFCATSFPRRRHLPGPPPPPLPPPPNPPNPPPPPPKPPPPHPPPPQLPPDRPPELFAS